MEILLLRKKDRINTKYLRARELSWTKKPINKNSLLIYIKNICLELLSASIVHEKFYSGNYGGGITNCLTPPYFYCNPIKTMLVLLNAKFRSYCNAIPSFLDTSRSHVQQSEILEDVQNLSRILFQTSRCLIF